ncbi:MAG: PTS system mannose/fructose/sorbose family transporter subunit IID [Desulfuromonadales bacterium]|nr:PTS system mannose/fructose/sorbose family transporter subunit IID [Desulfuromonadales bacterium]
MSQPVRLLLLKTFVRSFLLQTSWNFERLQNLGFLFMILPGLRIIYGSRIPEEVLERHKDYFNTHPYFAPMVAGATLRMEATLAAGEDPQVDISSFKKMVMAPFAAIGDSLFWGGVRPLAAIIALFMAAQGSLWAPLVFLALFNLPHLVCRGGGLLLGYFGGLRAIESIQKFHLPDLSVRCKEGSIILLGVMCAYLAHKGCNLQDIPSCWGFIILPVALLFARFARQGVSSMFLILVTTTSLLALALVF